MVVKKLGVKSCLCAVTYYVQCQWSEQITVDLKKIKNNKWAKWATNKNVPNGGLMLKNVYILDDK